MKLYDTPPIAGIYGRVSDNRKGKSASVPQQLSAGETVSQDEGWNLTYRLEGDDGRAASRFSTDKREDWDRLIELTTNAEVQIWILWECSRGSRRPVEWLTFLDLCRENEIVIYVISHERSYDPRIPRDWKILANEGIDAAYEVEMTSKRVGRDKADRAISGIPDGAWPQGYERIYDPKTKALLEQRPSAYAPVIKEIFDQIEQLIPLSRIEEDFATRGILSESGARFRRTSILQTARNPVYMGKRFYKGVMYDGQWEPIIPPAQWYTVNKILDDPKRKTTRPGRRRHLLTYWMTCGVCGETVQRLDRSKRQQRPTYACPPRCVASNQEWVDDYVRDLILEWVGQPEQYRKLTTPKAEGVILAVEGELEALKAEMDQYYALAKQRRLSPVGLAEMEEVYLPQIEAAKERLQDLTTPPPLRALVQPGRELRECWDDMDVPQRHAIVTWLFKGMSLLPSEHKGKHTSFDWRRLKYEWAH
ncbi:recombinase family protein [Phytomonospora sp. NPDC050363]|uniref:recombinase family protein n=1 Tax=Phytomonospora sp. NPDC050363 TaxID=3155642 RepID=UPI0033D8F170